MDGSGEVLRLDRYQLLALEVYTLLRTDRIDWIKPSTAGEGMWVELKTDFRNRLSGL